MSLEEHNMVKVVSIQKRNEYRPHGDDKQHWTWPPIIMNNPQILQNMSMIQVGLVCQFSISKIM